MARCFMKVLTDTNQLTKQAFIGMPPVSNADSASHNQTRNQTTKNPGSLTFQSVPGGYFLVRPGTPLKLNALNDSES